MNPGDGCILLSSYCASSSWGNSLPYPADSAASEGALLLIPSSSSSLSSCCISGILFCGLENTSNVLSLNAGGGGGCCGLTKVGFGFFSGTLFGTNFGRGFLNFCFCLGFDSLISSSDSTILSPSTDNVSSSRVNFKSSIIYF